MSRISVRDIMTVHKREITQQGYLKAPTVLGRCGVQSYTRGELGLDGDRGAIVRLMRTPQDVFRPETLISFENVPITDDHPSETVKSENWKSVSIGHVRDVARSEGDLLTGTVLVMDGAAVQKIVGGKTATSCGYSFDLDMTQGIAPDNQSFDGYQRNILGDHLSIVDAPRGGPICRIGDKEKGITMGMKKLAVDGLPRFEVDELAAEAIETHCKKLTTDRDQVVTDLASHRTASKKAFATKDESIVAKDKALAEKDTEIADLKAKLAKAQAIDVDALVAERAQVILDSKKLAPELEAKGNSLEIRKAAIVVACADAINKTVTDKMLGDAGIEKATDSQIKGVFEVLLALPRQTAINAQDEAINRALGATSAFVSSGPIEVLDGIPEDRKPKAA